MRTRFGLPAPERRISEVADDFAQRSVRAMPAVARRGPPRGLGNEAYGIAECVAYGVLAVDPRPAITVAYERDAIQAMNLQPRGRPACGWGARLNAMLDHS